MQNKSITPEQYFSYKMNDIKAVPIGAEKYDYMVNLIHELRKCRDSEDLTKKVLDPFFKTPFDDKEIVEEWLMSALQHDYSFVYAYNCMAEDQNTTGYRYEKKFVSEHELHSLLIEEQEEAHKQNTASSILDSEDPDLKDKLTKIYTNAKNAKVIDCSLESFLYWFGGRCGEPQSTITWKKLNREGRFHKSALLWFCREINPDMKPREVNKIFNSDIVPQNNNYSPGIEILKIFK